MSIDGKPQYPKMTWLQAIPITRKSASHDKADPIASWQTQPKNKCECPWHQHIEINNVKGQNTAPNLTLQ